MRSEDYITELLWKSAHVFPNSTQIPSVPPPPILYGGGGLEDIVQLPPPPSPLFIDEIMTSWLEHNHADTDFFSGLILPGVVTPTPGPWVPPVVRQSTPQVGSSTERQATAVFGGVSETFVVPSLDWNEKALATEISETSSFGFSMAETYPIHIQPATETETETETETADDWKLKERKENADEIEKTKGGPGSTPRKRSRAAEMHNLSEKKRREKISDKMKSLQELIPHCNTSDKASMLEDVTAFVKWSIQLHRYMVWNGMMQMMYTAEMQRFMPHMNMGMNIDFPRPAHIPGQGPLYPPPPYPFPKGQQPDPTPNQPQFPGHLDPYTEFVGLHHMQQRHPLWQNQTTAQLSFSQGSSTSELEGQKNQRTR